MYDDALVPSSATRGGRPPSPPAMVTYTNPGFVTPSPRRRRASRRRLSFTSSSSSPSSPSTPSPLTSRARRRLFSDSPATPSSPRYGTLASLPTPPPRVMTLYERLVAGLDPASFMPEVAARLDLLRPLTFRAFLCDIISWLMHETYHRDYADIVVEAATAELVRNADGLQHGQLLMYAFNAATLLIRARAAMDLDPTPDEERQSPAFLFTGADLADDPDDPDADLLAAAYQQDRLRMGVNVLFALRYVTEVFAMLREVHDPDPAVPVDDNLAIVLSCVHALLMWTYHWRPEAYSRLSAAQAQAIGRVLGAPLPYSLGHVYAG